MEGQGSRQNQEGDLHEGHSILHSPQKGIVFHQTYPSSYPMHLK